MNGMKKLLESSKGVLTLIVLLITIILAIVGKVESNAIVALVSMAQAVFCYTRMQSDKN